MTNKPSLQERMEKLIDKHTKALTTTHPEGYEIVSFDTRVVDTYELQQDLLSLIDEVCKSLLQEAREKSWDNTQDVLDYLEERINGLNAK